MNTWVKRLNEVYTKKEKLIHFTLIAIVFLIFLFFRSYNLTGRVGFGWDQERDAWAVKSILSGKPTLLGPRVQGPAGFFLPPYFFYLLTPFYAVTAGSPLATSIFIIFWSAVFFGLAYRLIFEIFNKRTALYFMALWAVNPLAVSIDTIAWNPIVVPLAFILLLYLLYLYLKKKKIKYLFLAGICFGLGMSFHLQFLFVFPVFIPVVIEIIKNKKIKQLINLGVGTVLPFLPIFLFDLRHNFLNFNQIIVFAKEGSGNINRVLPVWERVASFVLGITPSGILGIALYLIVGLGLLALTYKLKNKINKKTVFGLGLVWIFSLPFFYLFIKNPSEYYFNYLLVPLILFISLFLVKFKHLGAIVLAVTVFYFAFRAAPVLRDSHLNLREKSKAVIFLSEITKNSTPFNVSFDVPANEDSGFRYMLDYYKVGYSGDFSDPLIEFVIPGQKRKDIFVVGEIGIDIPEGWLKDNWPGKAIKIQ